MSGTVLGTRWDLERGRCGEGAGVIQVWFLLCTAEIGGDVSEQWFSARRFCPPGVIGQSINFIVPLEGDY